MFVRSWKCDLCLQPVSDEEVRSMSGGADIRVPGSNLRIRFAGLRVEKGAEEVRDLCPECRQLITECILKGKPWATLSALPASQRSLLLSASGGV